MQTMVEFITKHGITMHCEGPIDRNPNMEDDEWSRTATHWRCVMRRGDKRMTTYFSQGPAHTSDPALTDVLSCLTSDAQGIDQDFESWASDLGYDADSRKAEKTYNAVKAATRKLETFLGQELMEELTRATEGV